MMLNVLYEGKSEGTWKTSTQENSTLSWKTTERMEVTMNPALRELEVVSSKERVVTTDRVQTAGFTTGKLQEYSQ
jgi:hypothetical protein